MFNKAKFRRHLLLNDYTIRDLAAEIGVSEATLYNKMRSGIFCSDEIVAIGKVLKLSKKQMLEIFFANINT